MATQKTLLIMTVSCQTKSPRTSWLSNIGARAGNSASTADNGPRPPRLAMRRWSPTPALALAIRASHQPEDAENPVAKSR